MGLAPGFMGVPMIERRIFQCGTPRGPSVDLLPRSRNRRKHISSICFGILVDLFSFPFFHLSNGDPTSEVQGPTGEKWITSAPTPTGGQPHLLSIFSSREVAAAAADKNPVCCHTAEGRQHGGSCVTAPQQTLSQGWTMVLEQQRNDQEIVSETEVYWRNLQEAQERLTRQSTHCQNLHKASFYSITTSLGTTCSYFPPSTASVLRDQGLPPRYSLITEVFQVTHSQNP